MKKYKSKIFCILLLIIVFNITNIAIVYADISSPAAVVICEETGRILYNKNCNEKRKMASLTKLMTSILLVENCNLDEKITINPKACYIGGSEAGIKPNEQTTTKDLLYGMLLPSGNDCALATALHIGGSVDNFVIMMNNKAKELNLTNTHFENPHGLDSDEHYTTAYEMALIARYALSYDSIRETVKTKEKDVMFGDRVVHLRNTNALLRTYDKATGMKTGFTNGANRCLVSSASSNGLNLIAVVLGSETTQIRFNESQQILEETFNNYNIYDLSSFLNVYINIPVIKGNISEYIKTYNFNLKEALNQDEYSKVHIEQNFIQKIDAPLPKGTYLGTYTLKIENEILFTKDFFLENDILKLSPKDYFIYIIKNMFDKFEYI